MKLSYFGGGLIKTGGYGFVKEKEFVRYKFARNSFAYLKRKAEMGKLERVFIDKVILKSTVKTFHKHLPMYVDKLNTMYNEGELVTLEEAQEIIDTTLYVATLKDHRIPQQKEIKPTNIVAEFQPNEILYSKPAATQGRLEKIVILKLLNDRGIYMDSLHSLWNREDLVSQTEAKAIALKYWEDKKEYIVAEIRREEGSYYK